MNRPTESRKATITVSTVRLWLLLSFPLVVFQVAFAATQDDWQDIDRVVAIGDIHGDYANYLEVLKEAGVVDRRGKWNAGATHVVQVGDIPDRGPDTLKIIEHLQKLEKQARKAGGFLHLLVGNHEYMNVTGDLRYVHPGEFDAFKTRNSKRLRDDYYQYIVTQLEQQRADLLATDPDSAATLPVVDKAFKAQWYEERPLGFLEHRIAWQVGGDIQKWVATHNTVIRINDVLYLHGGLGPEMLELTMTDINDSIRGELNGQGKRSEPLGTLESGPLWYRGLARHDEASELTHLTALLDHFQVNRIVLGHTPDLNVITPRFGGQVVIIDTGISAYYGGHRASLMIDQTGAWARHERDQLAIPDSESSLLNYFEQLSEQQPKNGRLSEHLRLLQQVPVEDGLSEAALNSPTVDSAASMSEG